MNGVQKLLLINSDYNKQDKVERTAVSNSLSLTSMHRSLTRAIR